MEEAATVERKRPGRHRKHRTWGLMQYIMSIRLAFSGKKINPRNTEQTVYSAYEKNPRSSVPYPIQKREKKNGILFRTFDVLVQNPANLETLYRLNLFAYLPSN
jgi:hypothetical protein